MKSGLDEAQAGIKNTGRNTNNLRYTETEEELNNLLMKMKEESENVGLKFNIQKLRSWHVIPSLHGKSMGRKQKQWQTLFSQAPKSLQMVTVAMELNDTSSLGENLWQT